MILALAIVTSVSASATRVVSVSPFLSCVELAVGVVFRWVRPSVTSSDLHELTDAGDWRLHSLELLNERLELAVFPED